MAYRLTYGYGILFDPYTNDVVYDAKLTAKSNTPDYLDFTVPHTHALYGEIRERGEVVRLEWDGEALFLGEVESIDVDIEGNKEVACAGALAWLGDTVVRPYSTIEGEQPDTAPASVDGLFAWYVDRHNAHILDDRRRFAVGVNQGGALDENNHVYRSSEQLPTTWDEIEDKILNTLGGYVTVGYGETCSLNLYADVHETNAQVIDFGVNITDFSETTDTSDMYTAVRAVGKAPDKEEGSEEEPEAPTLADLPDGKTDAEGIYKLGDVVYSADAVARYGYRECAYSDNDCTTAAGLLTSAVKRLQALMAPSLTVTVKAVDLALYMDGYDHLRVGQAVRVRSAFHGVDEYLMVSSATVDLQDPGNTEYTLGAEYSTLTGQQSGYLKTMNGSINSALDATTALSSETKAAAKAASDAASAAETAQASADTANDAAAKAQDAADTAQQSAEKAASDAAASLDQAKQELSADATAKADAAQKAATEAAAQDATAKADQAKAGAVETAAADATTKADAAQKAAEETASADATAKADAAVAAAKTYADAQIKVASDSITSTVSETYETKADAASTKTQVTQNADSITTLVSRADSVDTLIRESSDGVEVGKTEDGSTYTGYHTLVGTDSFQIHDGEHAEVFGMHVESISSSRTVGEIVSPSQGGVSLSSGTRGASAAYKNIIGVNAEGAWCNLRNSTAELDFSLRDPSGSDFLADLRVNLNGGTLNLGGTLGITNFPTGSHAQTVTISYEDLVHLLIQTHGIATNTDQINSGTVVWTRNANTVVGYCYLNVKYHQSTWAESPAWATGLPNNAATGSNRCGFFRHDCNNGTSEVIVTSSGELKCQRRGDEITAGSNICGFFCYPTW